MKKVPENRVKKKRTDQSSFCGRRTLSSTLGHTVTSKAPKNKNLRILVFTCTWENMDPITDNKIFLLVRGNVEPTCFRKIIVTIENKVPLS
jgi:hypothetical protein